MTLFIYLFFFIPEDKRSISQNVGKHKMCDPSYNKNHLIMSVTGSINHMFSCADLEVRQNYRWSVE